MEESLQLVLLKDIYIYQKKCLVVNWRAWKMNKGYIALHRRIMNHWVYKNDTFFKWWTIMLFEANYTDKKFNLGYSLYDIKRGECANSLRTWAVMFNCGTRQVTRFFKLLENDGMITKKTIGKGRHSTTLINISNYGTYQVPSETQETTQETTLGQRKRYTTNKGNKGNNNIGTNKIKKREEDFREQVFSLKTEFTLDTLKSFFDYWSEPDRTKNYMRFEKEKTWDLRRRIKRWANNDFNSRFESKSETEPVFISKIK